MEPLVTDAEVRQPPLTRLSGPLGLRVRRERVRILHAVVAVGASNVRVFGSVARGEDGPDSDLDLVVEPPRGMGLFGLMRLQSEIEDIVRVKVDLVPGYDSFYPEVQANAREDLIAL